MSRVAVYDLYWDTMGGGEQVAGSIAETLVAAGHDVTLLGPTRPEVEKLGERLGVDLSGCRYALIADDSAASTASARFDVFVNVTYLSRARNRASRGVYYVHFPQEPPSRWRRARNRGYIGMVKALGYVPGDVRRVGEVRAAFDRRVVRTDFIGTYERFLANSMFTAAWVRRLWNVDAEVLHPPVSRVPRIGTKRPLIVNLGRFFDPALGHSKKQLQLVDAFSALEARPEADGWELGLVGGCDAANREYLLAVKRAARGHRVTVHLNRPRSEVARLLGEASLYWHGAGFGEDEQRTPHRAEHFGIALIEAMGAGAVPLVYPAAGPGEIVRHGVEGYHWRTLDELVTRSLSLLADGDERAAMSAAAVRRAGDFGAERFRAELLTHLAG